MNDDPSAVSAANIGPIPPLLRLPAVLEATGLGRSTVYRLTAEHAFPAPVKLAKRAVGWRDDDVRRWTSGRPSTADAQGSNGLLRQYPPKGIDISGYSQAKLNAVARQLNERPRKTLGFQTPAEMFSQTVALTG
jgi:predicted DNA-binding transcriptional regulator AlpA